MVMHLPDRTSALAWVVLAAGTVFSQSAPDAGAPEWTARTVEHLYNRAGFGARSAEIEAGVHLGREALVKKLLTGSGPRAEPFLVEEHGRPRPGELAGLDADARREKIAQYRREDQRQIVQFAGWWVEQMLSGNDPLRERMTLLWHGWFTSSMRDVKNSGAMIRQNEFLREHALGSFRELVHGILRDPAMLDYLDNNKNRKDAPNENLARELMELFTLGEGHYTEQDVKEAARALSGWWSRDGEFFVNRRQHDGGTKTVLGRTGAFDADDLADILLEQEACPRWVASRLIEHLEGRAPSPQRVADYASFLRAHDFRIDAFLERLFNDPEFYADDVVAARISGPLDFLVGSCKRLGIDPPPAVVASAAGILGQRVFDPPSVKGWDGGRAWITTSSFLQRGNMAGMLLGVVKIEDVMKGDPAEPEPDPEDPATPEPATPAPSPEQAPGERRLKGQRKGGVDAQYRGLKLLESRWRPNLNLTARCELRGVGTDAQIVDYLGRELLAVEISPESRAALLGFVGGERAALGVDDGALTRHPDCERTLRRLAHLILSLPDAQLH
jgi:uncharacterized protein DUF1800